MDAYVFSTDHAGTHSPYLFVTDQNASRPGHPDGKSWVPWKAVQLTRKVLNVDADTIIGAIDAHGFYISR
jgi:hypothetical protein